MRRRRRDAISVVEAAYAPAASEEEWLRGLVLAGEAELGEGMGVFAYTYDASNVPIQIGTFVAQNSALPREVATAVAQAMDEDYVARTWRALTFALGSEDTPFTDLPGAQPLVDLGIYDMVNINAYEQSGIGVCLHAPLPRQRAKQPEEQWTWTRVATHIATGRRLRAKPAQPPSAILSPRGKVEHAENEARDRVWRDLLSDSVRRIEQARGSLRRSDPHDALAQWKCLVGARYTLVDRFEHDGRRYVVAVENAGIAPDPAVLTPRERQVVAASAAGRTNKLVAYELGLSDSTVRVLLARAMRKLAVKTRAELVALFLAHARS